MRKNLSANQIEKYSRQIVLKNVGTIGQKKILSSNVLVVGAGGLGCPIVDYLTMQKKKLTGILDSKLISIKEFREMNSKLQKNNIYIHLPSENFLKKNYYPNFNISYPLSMHL